MKNLKPWYITSGVFAGAGIICLIVKLIELTLRTEHAWAETFFILGIIFLGIAIVILGVIIVIDFLNGKKEGNDLDVSEEELLSKYKSKSKK